MITVQDLEKIGNNESKRIEFVYSAIKSHSQCYDCQFAKTAQEYNRGRNTTIVNYQKVLYTVSGNAIPDNYSANYKLCSNFFHRLVTQLNQYLLGNGINFSKESTKSKLGDKFDIRVQQAGGYALVDKVSFGFWNNDHLEVFRYTEFVPIYDEINGSLSAGIRFWQVDKLKPIRATLYEIDGYTDYIWEDGIGRIYKLKRPYKFKTRTTIADGTQLYGGENYYDGQNNPLFPIVPFWGNPMHQSELMAIRENIDCYDLIKSSFASDIDDASMIYWTLTNTGGMEDIDLAAFVKRMKTVKAAVVDSDTQAESHTIDVPYASREALLERLRNDIYDDFMGLDTRRLSSSSATATEIRSSYEPLDNKANQYEFCVIDFIMAILNLAGIKNESPTFTRSRIINTQEEIQTILSASEYLPRDYITEKILSILGDIDRLDEVLAKMDEEEITRMSDSDNEDDTE